MAKERHPSAKQKRSIFLRLSLLVFAVYVIIMLVQLQMEISAQQQANDAEAAEITRVSTLDEDLANKLANQDEFMEEQARNSGYVYPGEDVLVEAQ